MRRLLSYCWMYVLFLTGALWWTKRRLVARGCTVVLTFHRVLDEGEYRSTSSLPGIIVRTKTFSDLARYLSRRCRPVCPTRIYDGSGRDRRIPVVVTFDDGWKDNFVNAFPIASQYGIPITIFVCPGLEGRVFPFWPESAVMWWRQTQAERGDGVPARFATAEEFVEFLKVQAPADRDAILSEALGPPISRGADEASTSVMTWAEMKFLVDRNVVFGSHTQTHVLLPQLNGTEVERELVTSRKAIQEQLNVECRLLAYPNGDFSPAVRAQAHAAGYTMAFTTIPGASSPSGDPLLIPRINVWERKLTGLTGRFSRVAFEYSVFWKAARAARS